MGDFVSNLSNTVFPDRTGGATPSDSYVGATELNAAKTALLDLRAGLLAETARAQAGEAASVNPAAPAVNSAALVTATGSSTARTLAEHTRALYHAGDTVVNVKGPPYNAKGDGSTDDTAAIVAIEATSRSVATLPAGTYPLADSTLTQKEYTGDGVFSFGGTLVPTTRRSPASHAAHRAATVLGDLSQIYSAIQGRSATVVIVGDSITEGVFQNSYEDAWASLFAEELRRRLPGVTWNIQNLSIAGVGIGALQSPSFVGDASVNDYAAKFYRPKGTDLSYATSAADFGVKTGNPDLWPSGSTPGKSWRDHVRDAAPDLVIIAHGQNDTSGDGAGWATNAKSFITYARGWTKPPSIAIMTAYPPTRKQATWRGYAPGIQVSADAARGVALETNATLLDANRIWLLYRDGIDYVSPRRKAVDGLASYPASWSGTITLPTKTTGALPFTTPGKLYSNAQAKDLHVSAQFTPTTGSTAFGIIYRVDSFNVGAHAYEAQVNNNFLRWYWGGTQLTTVSITPPANGSPNVLDVDVRGAHHVIRLNGVKLVDLWDYNGLIAGSYGLEFNGPGSVSTVSTQADVPKQIGPPLLTDDELLGISPADYWTNPNTGGGDGIHHPTPLGHYLLFISSLGLIDAAERAYNVAAPVILQASSTATTGALAATDFVSVNIGGAFGGAAMVTGSGSLLGATALNQGPVTVTGAQVIPVSLYQNGTVVLAASAINLPTAGTYLLSGTGTATQNGATIRHAIYAWALRIR